MELEKIKAKAKAYAASKSSADIFRKAHYNDYMAGALAVREEMFSIKEVCEGSNKVFNWLLENRTSQKVVKDVVIDIFKELKNK